jgi:hypothetical protein
MNASELAALVRKLRPPLLEGLEPVEINDILADTASTVPRNLDNYPSGTPRHPSLHGPYRGCQEFLSDRRRTKSAHSLVPARGYIWRHGAGVETF